MSLAEAVLNALVGAVLLVAYLLLAGFIEIPRNARRPGQPEPQQSDSPHAPQSEAAPAGVSAGYSSRRQDAPRSC